MSTYITKRANELGLKVVDAKSPLMLKVEKEDVDKSTLKNSKMCAFARAAERTLPIRAAFFFKTTAWLEYEDKIVRYNLPPSMQKEIISFDRSRSMEPGTYRLASVNPAGTLKAKDAWRAKAKKAGKTHQSTGRVKGRKAFRHVTTNVRDVFDPSFRVVK